MFSFSQALRSQLSTSVGNQQDSDPLDVMNTRRNFASLGRHSEDIQRPVIDQELDTSIRGFQRDKGLKEDGLMNPGGQTERALNRNLSRVDEINAGSGGLFAPLLSLSAPVGSGFENRNQDVQQVQQGLGGLGLASEAKLFEPSGIIDRETVDGVQGFQEQNGLRVDGFLNPGGETETAINEALRVQVSDNDEGDEEKEEEGPPPPSSQNEDGDEPDCTEEKEALAAAIAERDQAESEGDDAESELETAKSRLESLQEELRELEDKTPPKPKRKPDPAIVAEIQQLQTEVNTLEGLRSPIQKEINVLNEKIAPLREEKETLERNMEGANEDAFDLLPFFDAFPEGDGDANPRPPRGGRPSNPRTR